MEGKKWIKINNKSNGSQVSFAAFPNQISALFLPCPSKQFLPFLINAQISLLKNFIFSEK
jgi:hypothetical protein